MNGEKIDFKGSAMYVMALQGMKPHHAGTFFLQYQNWVRVTDGLGGGLLGARGDF